MQGVDKLTFLDKGDMEARCVLNEGTYEHTSPSRRLGRNTEFGHEFKL
jgi:hypothetical protein